MIISILSLIIGGLFLNVILHMYVIGDKKSQTQTISNIKYLFHRAKRLIDPSGDVASSVSNIAGSVYKFFERMLFVFFVFVMTSTYGYYLIRAIIYFVAIRIFNIELKALVFVNHNVFEGWPAHITNQYSELDNMIPIEIYLLSPIVAVLSWYVFWNPLIETLGYLFKADGEKLDDEIDEN